MPDTPLGHFVSDFGIYFFCVVGVLASRYLPQFKARETIPVGELGWGEVAFAMVIAFMVVFLFDANGEKPGKRAAFKRRAAFALANGFMWDKIVEGS